MTDSRPYDVPITLADGVPRTLRYTWSAVRRMREHGLDFLAMSDVELTDNLHVVLWAGLVWQDVTLTPDSISDQLSLYEVNRVGPIAVDAVLKSSRPEVPAPDPLESPTSMTTPSRLETSPA